MADNLDKYFRDQLSKEQVPFDPSLWEEAAARLDEKDKKKRILFWWIPIGLGVMLIAGFLWYTGEKSDSIDANDVELNVLPTIAASPSGPQEEENAKLSIEAEPEISSSQVIHSSSKQISNQVSANVPKQSGKQNLDIENTSTTLEFNSKQTNDNTNNQVATTDIDASAASSNASQKPLIEDVGQLEKTNTDIRTIEIPKQISFPEISQFEPVLPDEGPTLADIEIFIPGERGWTYGLTTEFTLQPGTSQSLFYNKGAGIFGGYNFSMDWGLQAGIDYRYLTGDFGTVASSTQTVYGFGSQNTSQSLEMTGFNFIETPIFLYRNFRDHRLSIGLKPSYLLSLNGKKETSFYPNGGTLARVEAQRGSLSNIDDFNRWNMGALLRYSYPFRKIQIGVSGQYMFKSFSKNEINTADPVQPYSFGVFFQYVLK